MSHLVFAYGSNMHLGDLARWMGERGLEPGVSKAAPARLDGHRLAFNYRSPARGGGAANVVPEAGAQVPGVVLEVTEATLAALDVKEGHPHRYRREACEVVVAGGARTAWVYRVTGPWQRGRAVPPTRAYLALMIAAAEAHGLDAGHLEALRSIPVDDHPALVRPAGANDAERIAAVQLAAWRATYPGIVPQAYLDGLDHGDWTRRRREALSSAGDAIRTWVLEARAAVPGFAVEGASRDRDAGEGVDEIYALYIEPGRWGEGLGRTLVEHVVHRARAQGAQAVTLWVLSGNAPARAFYEALAFRPEAEGEIELGGAVLPRVRYRRAVPG